MFSLLIREWLNESINEMNLRIMNEWTSKWIKECMNEWMVNEWMNGVYNSVTEIVNGKTNHCRNENKQLTVQMNTWQTTHSISEFVANAVVTCEAKLFQPSSMSTWNKFIPARGNLAAIISELCQRLGTAYKNFPTCSISLK